MDTNDRNKFIELRAKGLSFDKISKEIGKSKQTLINWNKEYLEEIQNTRSLELETLREKYFLAKEHKIKVFGDLLEKIKKEIDTRDLSTLPLDKLYLLFLKYHTYLAEDKPTLSFRSTAEIMASKTDREINDSLLGISKFTQAIAEFTGDPLADVD